MRYLIHTNGDLKHFIAQQIGETASVLKQNDDGFYALFSSNDNAFLSACINPQGGSTVSSDQFNRNRIVYDTRPARILPWLFSQAEFQDRRCLWAHLSMPLSSQATPESAYRALETAWAEWSDWWKPNFPAP